MYCFSITPTFASLGISLGSPTISFLIVFSMKEGTVPSVVGSVEASYIGVQIVATKFLIASTPDNHCGMAVLNQWNVPLGMEWWWNDLSQLLINNFRGGGGGGGQTHTMSVSHRIFKKVGEPTATPHLSISTGKRCLSPAI